ncbi:type II toxin-antitoxin system RelE/ParE family toxin [Ruegeria atlantica]|uniref:type II toxin-antitoxin system RelE/ParE family toxin n=1 Tax=Ruegeria atlantica TaxID=81569 RepID=UPI002494A023|nr:type II toxin-antitoxin system RelE/ParE family toxin [Ruegeria atlantica]
MTRPFRLTRRAESSLVEIARWTIDKFGPHQADLYEQELIARCQAITEGRVASRSCSLLVEEAADLRYVQAGEHFLVYLDQPDSVIIVDILHSRCNLPRHVSGLVTLMDAAGKKT